MKNIDDIIEEINDKLLNNYGRIHNDDEYETCAEVYINDTKTFRIDMCRKCVEYYIYDLERGKYCKNLVETSVAQKAISEICSFAEVEEIQHENYVQNYYEQFQRVSDSYYNW